MTDTTFWLGRAGVLALLLAAASAIAVLFGAGGPGRTGAERYVADLDARLRFLRSGLRGRRVLAAQVGLGAACAAAALLLGQWPLWLAVPAVAVAPKIVLEQRVAARLAAIEAQIEPWLGAVANALRASPSLGEAIASTTALIPAPMSEEIDVLVKEHDFGTPLDRALDGFAARIASRTLASTVLALKIARKSGGDLTALLESLGGTLRELARLEGVVRSKTAEGKAQALVIAVIPAPMVALIHLMEPGFFAPLASTFLGHLVLGGAALLWGIAVVAAQKILAVDV